MKSFYDAIKYDVSETPCITLLGQRDSVSIIEDPKVPRKNMLESVKGDRQASSVVRINDQYRVYFQ